MSIISVQTPTKSYDILIDEGLLEETGELLRERGLKGKAAIVTNPTVGELYASTVARSLERAGFEAVICQAPDGESYKTLTTVNSLYERFIEAELDRSSTVLALGGGVIGDMAGFAAATYMRGLPLVHMPTTLLAMVDASLGGKVAVDHPRGKNLIGAFYQPWMVITDPATLLTLPAEEWRAGWAEVIKAGVVASPALFEHLEVKGGEPLEWIIGQAVAVKVAVVEEDPYEKSQRAILNLGHTFGHALEVLSDFTLRHGEAVSIGLVAAAKVALALEMCDKEVEQRLVALLHKFELPTGHEGYDPQRIWEAMAMDKKKRGKELRFVLPRAIGEVVITTEVPQTVVLDVLVSLAEG